MFSFARLLWVIAIAYIANSVYTFYDMFTHTSCTEEKYCVHPMVRPDEAGKWPLVQFFIHIRARNKGRWGEFEKIYEKKDVDVSEAFEETISIKLPSELRNNGSVTLFLLMVDNEYNEKEKTSTERWRVEDKIDLSYYDYPQVTAFNLIGSEENGVKKSLEKPIPKLQTVIPINFVLDPLILDRRTIPGEVSSRVFADQKSQPMTYLPLINLDTMRVRLKDQLEVYKTTETTNVTVSFRPVSWGLFRLGNQMKYTFVQFEQMGFGKKDCDDIKGMFSDINFTFLALMVTVAAVHILFDFLTFKNEIQFWKGRKTIVGISTKALVWSCFSETVVFFYLWDERSSYLVLIPCGIGVVVGFWKLRRAMKASFYWDGWVPKIRFGDLSEEEKQTDSLDGEAMKYLTYLLIPLCIAGAIYNLVYVPQKSWFNWIIKCLANCIYAFGFLFMLPQLFLNYKLKSVAHLPWRAFMYKAFNTFIDDVFAFIITMPTSHRLACFRDDIVFLIYLYQRYLYPVDKTRVNEYGESFDQTDKIDQTESEKTKQE